MNREEAIKLIDTHTVCFYNEIDSPTLQALHMAIEALQADTVSREWYDDAVKANHELAFTDLPDIPRYYYEKVVGKMAHEINMLREQLESADAVQGVGRYENAMQKLREMPKYLNGVKAKQIKKIPSDSVQGEWIWRTDIPIGDGRTSAGYICSNCGKDYWHGNVFDYCPSCGARMKGGAE